MLDGERSGGKTKTWRGWSVWWWKETRLHWWALSGVYSGITKLCTWNLNNNHCYPNKFNIYIHTCTFFKKRICSRAFLYQIFERESVTVLLGLAAQAHTAQLLPEAMITFMKYSLGLGIVPRWNFFLGDGHIVQKKKRGAEHILQWIVCFSSWSMK